MLLFCTEPTIPHIKHLRITVGPVPKENICDFDRIAFLLSLQPVLNTDPMSVWVRTTAILEWLFVLQCLVHVPTPVFACL